ncbi:hypothetical protein M569_06173, partial [Genlisea aurea]
MASRSPDRRFCFSRWSGIGMFRPESDVSGNDDGESSVTASGSGECYACTQLGVPAFHSTSCDKAHQPEWEATAGSHLQPIKNRPAKKLAGAGHRVLDPRSKRVQYWNRAFLLARGMALAVDPLLFYSLSVGRNGLPCAYVDGVFAAAVTAARTCLDAVHLCHIRLQFKLAYVSRESLVVGAGKLVWEPRAVAVHYLRSLKLFWFDVFVILPLPQ